MKANSRTAGGANELPPASPAEVRLCEDCENPIPTARLKAMPYASRCVPCLEKSGDVLPTRRYDETTPDGEVISHHFRTPTPYVADVMRRLDKSTYWKNEDCGYSGGASLPVIKVADSEGEWGMEEQGKYVPHQELYEDGQRERREREREERAA